jgi:two-component system, cell cycle response regulator DivK
MKQILVVEDNENNQLVIEDVFRRHTHWVQLHFVSDGQHLRNFLQNSLPDLILLDMRLPDISGWELAEQLKNSEETQGIPIIAVTAHAMKGDESKALSAGCDDYVSKPVKRKILLDTVQKWIGPLEDSEDPCLP